jgi:hypothetical protein
MPNTFYSFNVLIVIWCLLRLELSVHLDRSSLLGNEHLKSELFVFAWPFPIAQYSYFLMCALCNAKSQFAQGSRVLGELSILCVHCAMLSLNLFNVNESMFFVCAF